MPNRSGELPDLAWQGNPLRRRSGAGDRTRPAVTGDVPVEQLFKLVSVRAPKPARPSGGSWTTSPRTTSTPKPHF
jgi:hypothetical protein